MSIRFLSILGKGGRAGILILSTTLPLMFVQELLAQTPNLSVGTVSATAGESIELPVSLAPGSAVISTLQFDLSFPASLVYVSTSTGSSAAAAGKSAQGNGISGGVRVLVFGANQNGIGSGPVAIVRLSVADDTSPGTISVTIGSIIASDGDGSPVTVNGSAGSVVVTQTPTDTTPPVITDVTISSVTTSGGLVTCLTDEPSDTQVEYGTSTDYGNKTAANLELVTSHLQLLSGLRESTLYHFRVLCTDRSGNLSVSEDSTFTTASNSGAVLTSLSYPRLNTGNPDQQKPQDDAQYTGVAVANLDDKTASLKFTAYDASGAEVSGTNISNPVSRTLKPGEQLPVVDTELFGPGLSQNSGGWVKVESTADRITGFFLIFNSGLTVLDGAALGQAPMSSFVLPEIEDQGFTRIHITNPSKDPVTVTLQLVQSDGTARSSVTRDIAGDGVLAGDLFSDLLPEITPVRSDYLRVSSSGGVSAHELLGKTDMFIEVLTGQDPAQGARTLYSPQYVLGGGWLSSLSIVNLDSSPGSLTLRFMNDDAVQVGESKVVPIPSQGKIHIDDRNFFGDIAEALVQGYVEIQSDGVRLAGDVVFGDEGRGVFSSALPLVGTLQKNVVFSHVASNERFFTGIAILNPNDAPATATVDVYAADGSLEFRTIEVIPARERRSRLLTQYFPTMATLDRSSGYVRLTVDKEVASFALFGTHDLSALSAIPGVVPR